MHKNIVSLNTSIKVKCTIANGKTCLSIGSCVVPIGVKGIVKFVNSYSSAIFASYSHIG